jgi:hypothetical protein
MPRASEIRTNFTAGELSTLINSRTQFQRYFNGSETLENWVVLTQGPIFRRKGFRFLAEVKDSTKRTRLIPFEFSTVQTYTIELGAGYLRFFSAQGQVLDSGSNILEISNPYLESELFDIKFVQDSDVIYMVHPNHPIQKLIRVASNNFTLNPVDLVRGPYIDENIISTDEVRLTGNGWLEGATLTLTASGGHTPFTSNHVGGLWKVKSGTDIAHVKITGFTSSTVVTVVAQNDVPQSLHNIASFNWSEGEFSNARGFAGAITFHEQRMVLAGSQRVWFSKSNADYENFEVGTNSDDPFAITIASQRGDPIRWLFSDQALFVGTAGSIFRIISSRNSPALAPDDIDAKRQISYGCSNIQPELVGQSPIYMQKNNKTARLITFDIDIDKYKAIDITVDSDHITDGGITSFEYQQIPLSSLWTVRTDGQIARLTLEQDQQVQAWSRYVTQGNFESVAIVSDAEDNDEIYAIVKRTINGVVKRFVEVQEPNYKVDNLNRFYVDSGLSYNGTQSSTITISGNTFTADSSTFQSGDIGKEIHQLIGKGRAKITGFTDSQNVTVSIIETFSSATLLPNEWAIAIKNITGSEHLEGETVAINSDGATVPSKIVSGGEVEIDSAGSIIHIGLPYSSKQKNMPIESLALSGMIGTSQHKDKRIHEIVVRFADTLGGKIIDGAGNEVIIPARSLNNNMNEAPPLFNGDQEIKVATGWDKLGQIEIIQDEPQPMTIKSITYKVTINDK